MDVIKRTTTLPDGTDGDSGYIEDTQNFVLKIDETKINTNIQAGNNYMFSLFVKPSIDCEIRMIQGADNIISDIAKANEWTRIKIQFLSNGLNPMFEFVAGEYYLYHCQLENGTIATDWTLSDHDWNLLYATKEEMASSIKVLQDSIDLKVNVGEVSSHLSLEKDLITIEGNRLVINSNNFKVSETGQVDATAGNIGCMQISGKDLIVSVPPWDVLPLDTAKNQHYFEYVYSYEVEEESGEIKTVTITTRIYYDEENNRAYVSGINDTIEGCVGRWSDNIVSINPYRTPDTNLTKFIEYNGKKYYVLSEEDTSSPEYGGQNPFDNDVSESQSYYGAPKMYVYRLNTSITGNGESLVIANCSYPSGLSWAVQREKALKLALDKCKEYFIQYSEIGKGIFKISANEIKMGNAFKYDLPNDNLTIDTQYFKLINGSIQATRGTIGDFSIQDSLVIDKTAGGYIKGYVSLGFDGLRIDGYNTAGAQPLFGQLFLRQSKSDSTNVIELLKQNGFTGDTVFALKGDGSLYANSLYSNGSPVITESYVTNTLNRVMNPLVPRGDAIPANANLNTTTYIKVGSYHCGSDSTVATLTNRPTNNAFMMMVYSPLSKTYDDETTRAYVYRVRVIMTYLGALYIQNVMSGSTAGTFTYSAWKQIDPPTWITGTTRKDLSSVSHSGWTKLDTDKLIIPSMAFIALWNGAYNSSGSSNLQYCDRGRFGTIVTKSSGDYLQLSGGTLTGNLNMNTYGKGIYFNTAGTSYIAGGNKDAVTGAGGDLCNLVISSWYGLSITSGCDGTWKNKSVVNINCRTGDIYITGIFLANEFRNTGDQSRISLGNNIALLRADSYSGSVNKANTAYRPLYASAFTINSSKLTKENISNITDIEAKKILKLNPISFDYKENFGGQKEQYGLIAEDVMNYIPSAVIIPEGYNEDNFDEKKGINQPILSLDYSKLVPHLIKLVQILSKEVEELKNK